MNRYALYTSVFGGFEKVWAPLDHSKSVTRYVVSDSPDRVPGWDSTVIPAPLEKSPRLSNRKAKILFHEQLTHTEATLYVDANVRPMGDLSSIFAELTASGSDLALYPHYTRSSVRAEAEACLQRGKVRYPDRVPTELDLYSKEGFPDDAGLWEGSVIFKNHQSPKLAAAMKEWWELYSRFENRDQFSLPFIIWKHGLTVLNLDSLSHGREHYFHRVQHSSHGLINRTARYLQARAPESAFWSSLHLAMRRVSRSP